MIRGLRGFLAAILLTECVGALVGGLVGGYAEPAHAQGAVQQSGPVTAFHLPVWWQNGIVGDAGSPGSPYINSLGMFDGEECPFGISSATGSGVPTAAYSLFTVCQTNTAMEIVLSGVGQSLPYPWINAGWVMGGSQPTASGSCPIGTQVGGNAAGSFKSVGGCSAGTVILTFSTTNPTGWACSAQDMTTPADTIRQTAYTTTTVTFTATMAASDQAVFSCQGF